MHFRLSLFSLLATVCLALPAAAGAQANDPEQGSPSGTIYEIPLDDGRGDAAPREPRPDDAAAATPTPSSPIRSQNGFGSSGTVPGTEPGGSEAAAAPGPTSSKRDPGDRKPRERQQRDGDRGTSDESDIPAGVVAQSASGSSPAVGRAGLLIALGIAVAGGLALVAGLAARRR